LEAIPAKLPANICLKPREGFLAGGDGDDNDDDDWDDVDESDEDDECDGEDGEWEWDGDEEDEEEEESDDDETVTGVAATVGMESATASAGVAMLASMRVVTAALARKERRCRLSSLSRPLATRTDTGAGGWGKGGAGRAVQWKDGDRWECATCALMFASEYGWRNVND